MTKVALILTGHLRYRPIENITSSISNIKSLFNNAKLDIFLSTYDDLGYFQSNQKDYSDYKNSWISSNNSSTEQVNEIANKFKIKYLNIEKFNVASEETESRIKQLINLNNLNLNNPGLLVSGMAQCRKRLEVFDYINNSDEKYDYVFQTRPDVITKFSNDKIKLSSINMLQISSIIYGKSENLLKLKRFLKYKRNEIPFYGEISMLMSFKNYKDYSLLYNKKFEKWIVDVFNSGNIKFISSRYDPFLISWEMPEYIISYAFDKLGFEISDSIYEILRDKPGSLL
jgi:hypothetical protein